MKVATVEENSRYFILGDNERGCKGIHHDTLYGKTMKGAAGEKGSREFTVHYMGENVEAA